MVKQMTSRERVQTALNHQEPDRVPLGMWMTLGAYKNFREYLGLTVKDQYPPGSTTWSMDVHVEPDVIEKLGLDVIRIGSSTPDGQGFKINENGFYVDEWSVPRKKVEYEGGYYMEDVNPPLKDATIADLEDYPWPDPTADGCWNGLEQKAKRLFTETDKALLAQFGRGGIYEQAKYLRGHEQILMDMILEPEFVHALFAKLCQVEMKFNEMGIKLIGKYLTQVRMSPEDLGNQDNLQISPKTFREMIKPYYTKSFGLASKLLKEQNPHAKLQFHSCGAIYAIVPDLIECGMEVSDPMQPIAKGVEPARLKQEFGDRLSWWGGIDVQRTLPLGTPEQVAAEVRTRIKEAAPGGGYILSSSHRCQPDIPSQNITTMYEAAKEYGQYPIKL